MSDYPRISGFKTADAFRRHLKHLRLNLELDDEIIPAPDSPLAQSCRLRDFTVGNRWCILPMEGWDCEADGSPGALTERRWLRFASSGAKLLFGCEAAAVMDSGRSNTRQMMITAATWEKLARLREKMVRLHAGKFGSADDLYLGLQLTHSGRYSHPNDDRKLESVTAYSHPLLDRRFGNDENNVVSDGEARRIIDRFIEAAGLAKRAGFHFVDVKMAHGYLGHEFLSAFTRPGPYGGSFENRTRFFREIVEGIRAAVPGLAVATRLSLFDFIPFVPGPGRIGVPMEMTGMAEAGNYRYAFGGDGTGLGRDFTEPIEFLKLAAGLGVELVCTTAGSPYYVPHIQRPAYYPVSDGYLPPEDPVVGAARQIEAVRTVKEALPQLKFIGSGYSCLQEFLPQVAQKTVADHAADFVGLGRMVLSYPEICADSLAGKPLDKRLICRTFGDCTTAPRNGLVSGCFPLDRFYREHPHGEILRQSKQKGPRREKDGNLS